MCETQGQELGFAPGGTVGQGRKKPGEKQGEGSQPDHMRLRWGGFEDRQSYPCWIGTCLRWLV